MPSPIVYFQISTPDPEAVAAFYLELFDWKLGEPGGRVSPTIDPQGPADFDVKGAFRRLPEGSPPAVTPFFRVADLWTTMARAEALGAPVVVPITQTRTAAPTSRSSARRMGRRSASCRRSQLPRASGMP